MKIILPLLIILFSTYFVVIKAENIVDENEALTCGSIVGMKIYDQVTDAEVPGIGILYNGISIDINDLPDNYYLVCETVGSISSVRIWVNGIAQVIENLPPYSYPSGAEADNNWNVGVGSYDIDANAYEFDNANNLCGSIWFSMTIAESNECLNVTGPGTIEESIISCPNENFTIENISSPTGGSGLLEYIWLSNRNGPSSLTADTIFSNTDSLVTQISEDTWFRRNVRRLDCDEYVAASNWSQVIVDPTTVQLLINNEGICPVGLFRWTTFGDIYELDILQGETITITTEVGEIWRVINTNHDWNDLQYDNHIELESCGFIEWNIEPDYCNLINPPTSPICGAGNFSWVNNIDVSILNGTSGIPLNDVRFVGGSTTQYVIPGPYPEAFNDPISVSINDVVSWDANLNRALTGDQPFEQWRIILRNNGTTVYTSPYTADLATGVISDETIQDFDQNINLHSGIDEIILAHYEDNVYGTDANAVSPNSVIPVGFCIEYEPICVADAPTPNNLTDEVTIECGDTYPDVTFTNGTIKDYQENSNVYKSCEIDLSTFPSYNWRNFWAHSFIPGVEKHFVWNDGNIIFLNDGTLRLSGRVENVSDNKSGFLIDFYFEELVDQTTFVLAGGYQENDADAPSRMFANVDFTKPNTMVGFGEFTDSDLSLVSSGSQHHMSLGNRDVYGGGYGFGFWIDYEGTINGIPVGNTATPSGANHLDMYSKINTCYEGNPTCTGEEFVIREWIIEDDCGDEHYFIQHVSKLDTEAPVAFNEPADVPVECNVGFPVDEPDFEDNCDDDLTIDYSEVVNLIGCQEEIIRSWTATDNCGNSTTVSQMITVMDSIAPVFDQVLDPVLMVECDDLPIFDDITASDNCDDNVDVTYTDIIFSGGCLNSVERIWSAEDGCGNNVQFTQIILIQDYTNPILINVPADVEITCSDDIPEVPEVFATDNCDIDVEVTFNEVQDGTECPYFITRTWTATDDCGNISEKEQIITIFTASQTGNFLMDLKLYVQGPMNTVTGLMNDALKSHSTFPLTEPYANLGFDHFGNGGSETISPSLLLVSGHDAIVDWIMIEIRDANNPSVVLQTKSALLQRDGDIVKSSDGISPVNMVNPFEFTNQVLVSINHRNHLKVTNLSPFLITGVNDTLSINFSDPELPISGENSMNTITFDDEDPTNDIRILISGDANGDGTINSIDKNNFWQLQNGQPYNYFNSKADFNLDGAVNTADKNFYWRVNNGQSE